MVPVRILLISSPGPDFIYLESGSGFYRCSPGPDCISAESGSRSGFYALRVQILYWSGSWFYPFLCPGPSPEFIKQVRVRVQVRIFPFRVPVRILSNMSGSGSGSTSGFYQHPAWKPSWSCVDHLNNIHRNIPWRLIMKLGFKHPSVFSRKRSLKMLNLSDLGQRSMNDLDLKLS